MYLIWLHSSRLSSGRATPLYTQKHPTSLPIFGISQLSYFSSVIGKNLYCIVLIFIWVITDNFEHLVICLLFLYVFSSEITSSYPLAIFLYCIFFLLIFSLYTVV